MPRHGQLDHRIKKTNGQAIAFKAIGKAGTRCALISRSKYRSKHLNIFTTHYDAAYETEALHVMVHDFAAGGGPL